MLIIKNLSTTDIIMTNNEVSSSTSSPPSDVTDATMGSSASVMDPLTTKGQQLCYLVIQELAMNRRAPPQLKDEVFISMCSCVTEILEKHSILFHGMIDRIDISHYQMFASVANELFEASSNTNSFDPGRLKITWARIVSLFAFSVRLAQEYNQDLERVDNITRFLITYVSKHVIPFVRTNGGWEGLVEQFPAPVDVHSQFRKVILLSGLCVGIVATMYITSLLAK